jgi:hypothetical protein
MRKWFLALALIVLPLAFAGAALAVPPTTEVTTIVDSVTVDSDICADFGFDVTFVENGTFKTTTFYDSEGNVVKSILSNFDVRYTSTATANGKTLSTNYPLVFITYTDADIRVGLRNAYHVPGEGVVLLDAGRLILDPATGEVTFEAGQHEIVEGSVDAFCGYFQS